MTSTLQINFENPTHRELTVFQSEIQKKLVNPNIRRRLFNKNLLRVTMSCITEIRHKENLAQAEKARSTGKKLLRSTRLANKRPPPLMVSC